MLGAKILRTNPVPAITDPRQVTSRQPYLLVRALAMGPVKKNNNISTFIITIIIMIIIIIIMIMTIIVLK